MGVKVGGGLLRCGTCGRQRGIRHTCVTSATSKRRRTRTTLKPQVTVSCTTCGKPRGLVHTCTVKTDFAKRKAAAAKQARRDDAAAKKRAAAEKRRAASKAATARRVARRKQAAAERRARDKARKTAAKVKPRSPRPRGDSHEPGTCNDRECPKYGCKTYWRGMDNCPGPHGP